MMHNSSPPRSTLRQLLTLPYVILVIVTASVIGLLSYFAGRNAVDTLSNYALTETVSRIAQAIDKHVAGSEAVLETAFPTGIPAPDSVKENLDSLRTRFWLATSIHRNPNNYAYYGARNGQFFGLYRFSEFEAELRVRTDGESPRSIYRYSGINGELGIPARESRIFEPRDRPWYEAGQNNTSQTWTSIYIDFKTLQLVSTRARRVNNALGEFEGVVATDLSLQLLNEFLKSLKLTENGFAFIVEPDGNLVATSRGPHIRKGVGDDNTRLNAAQSTDPLIAATYASVKSLTDQNASDSAPSTSYFKGPKKDIIQTGYYRLKDKAGLDWIIAVAVPRNDFLFQVTRNVKHTVLMGLLACGLIVLIGLGILNHISKDLRQLARAAKAIGRGEQLPTIAMNRNDEIGILANSFKTMQEQLLTDRLTGIANREAVTRHIEDRIFLQRRGKLYRPFAVLFVDLNGFKKINDTYGHDVGDKVLQEVAQLLVSNSRESDLVARYAGDEFIIFLNEVKHRKDAQQLRDNYEQLLLKPLQSLKSIDAHSSTLSPGASIGTALCPDDANDLDTLIKTADQRMYRRKKQISNDADAL